MTLEKAVRAKKTFSSRLLEKIHKGDIKWSKRKAPECETAEQKNPNPKTKRIQNFKILKKKKGKKENNLKT